MKYYIKLFSVLILLHSFSFMNCQQISKKNLLEKYNFDDGGSKTFNLDISLNEISGLTGVGNKFVYTHNDEKAIIFKIDISTGEIVSHFLLGKNPLAGDFEGITLVDDTIYLTSSSGVLYKFLEGKNGQSVDYQRIETGLKRANDIEGLCYDPDRNSLLLACKDVTKKKYKRFRTIYEFSLEKNSLSDTPRFLISLDELKEKFNISDFAPSGIARHPLNGNFFVVSANEPSIIELSSNGLLLNAIKLKDKKHRQTEGITILDDNTIILSDEAKGKQAKITIITYN